MDGDLNEDIYEDLPNFRYDVTLDRLRASVEKLEAENQVLQSRLMRTLEEKKTLNTSYSALFKTAKLEIQRKERIILDLREQLNKFRASRNQFGAQKRMGSVSPSKRRRETSVAPISKKHSSTAIRETLCNKEGARSSKPTSRTDEDRPADVAKVQVDKFCEKENSPFNVQPKEEPVIASPHGTTPSFDIAAPSLPAIACPTIFSGRMYKRIYGRSPEKQLLLTGAEQVHPVGTLPRRRENGRHRFGSERHFSKCSRVTPKDIKTYLLAEDPESDSSCSSTESALQWHSNETSSKVTRVDIKPLSQKVNISTHPVVEIHNPSVPPDKPESVFSKRQSGTSSNGDKCEPPKIEVQMPIIEPPVVLPVPSVPSDVRASKVAQFPLKPPDKLDASEATRPSSVPPEASAGTCSKANPNPETLRAKPIAKDSVLAVRKTRLQSIAIRPIKKLPAQETPEENRSADKCESEPSDDKVQKPNRVKTPGLPGSAKGRIMRQVFAPISNHWNYSLPTSQNEQEKRGELSVVQTVSVTSELTVRVDDSKIDLKKPSLAEAVFGSPIKWADDSLDSPVAEGSNNSRKIYYSIFGSPLKSVDSNSSEQPFNVPPGAYDDSLMYIPEKVQKAPAGGLLHKQNHKIQDVPAVEERAPKEAEKVTCPPPPVKKHVSIFSPMKDSKVSNNLVADDPSRSNTGIFFPFPRPKYEDSVLGQFDDTAQFVSAVAHNFKVNSQISPLSTPTKIDEGSNLVPSVVKNPTSFQEVFQKTATDTSNLENHSARSTLCSLPTTAKAAAQSPIENQPKSTSATTENPQPHKEPPTITITPPKSPKCDKSIKIIHQPNLASSTTSYSVKSWFPKGTPVNIVTPRRTPRLVTKMASPDSPKSLAKLSIDEHFIYEQEERVKRWELDHSESTLRVSGSPTKNGCPIRKKMDQGKLSPTKRSPKKQARCRSPRQAECRVTQCLPSHQPGEAVPNVPPETKLPDLTPKLLTMLSTIISTVKQAEPSAKVECDKSKCPADAEPAPELSSKHQIVPQPETDQPKPTSSTPASCFPYVPANPVLSDPKTVEPTSTSSQVPSVPKISPLHPRSTRENFIKDVQQKESTEQSKPADSNCTQQVDTNTPTVALAPKISAIKATTPLNKSVAALFNSVSVKPRPSTPQSAKSSNFKRSSALKPNQQNGSGLMNTIRSTLFQASTKEDNSKRRTPSRITNTPYQKELELKYTRKPHPTPSQVINKSIAETAVDPSRSPARAALSREPPKPEINTIPAQWKLHEVDRPTKPISLLKKFQALKDANALNNRNDSKCNETPIESNSDERISNGKPERMLDSKPPPKTQVQNCLRKTILLDAPMKLETPTKKRKRSGECSEAQPNKKLAFPGEATCKIEKASPEVLADVGEQVICALPRRPHFDPRKNLQPSTTPNLHQLCDQRDELDKIVKNSKKKINESFVRSRTPPRNNVRYRERECSPSSETFRRSRAASRNSSRTVWKSRSAYESPERSPDKKSRKPRDRILKKRFKSFSPKSNSDSPDRSYLANPRKARVPSKLRRSRSVSPTRSKTTSKSTSCESDKIPSKSLKTPFKSKTLPTNPLTDISPVSAPPLATTSAISTLGQLGLLGRRPVKFSST